MKIIHIADLHLGKKIGGYSLLDDQQYFLDNTINYAKENNINHLIIAGDIYDVSSPSGDAINMFSEFLNKLKENNIKAFIVSGNHDSKDRVGYGNKLISNAGIYINTNIKDALNPIFVDEINYYLIPFTTAAEINAKFEQNFKTYEEAMQYIVNSMNIDKTKINIAVAHQLVLSAKGEYEIGGSEDPIIGTIQNISGSIFKDFNYVALGHIHKPQNISKTIRYSGSPLAYHVDESKYDKTYTIIDIESDKLTITEEKINPLHEVVEIKDTFDNIINNYPEHINNYIYAVIEGNEVENAMAKLKNKYPYAVSIKYDKKESEGVDLSKKITDIENISSEDLFKKLYREQLGEEMNDFQVEFVNEILKECEENEA